jgi:hypothetical protein
VEPLVKLSYEPLATIPLRLRLYVFAEAPDAKSGIAANAAPKIAVENFILLILFGNQISSRAIPDLNRRQKIPPTEPKSSRLALRNITEAALQRFPEP